MSHSTLEDFYKGMRQPRYDGSNVLNQLKMLSGGVTRTETVTVTKTTKVSGEGYPTVPPIAVGPMKSALSTLSFEGHVAQSMTEQAASKMFNEQSFGP